MIHGGIHHKTKLILIVIILLVMLAIGLFIFKNMQSSVGILGITSSEGIPTAGEYCFARTQKATNDAPYSVEEHVVLNFDGEKVSGTKSGTQSGPDMTNGYEGTLAGTTIDDGATQEMELTYAYTIEGSTNRELEVYTFSGKDLIKKRWALKEEHINGKSILVPDYVGNPTLMKYKSEECGG